MTASQTADSIDEQLKCISDLMTTTMREGKKWLHDLQVDDWRSLRYRTKGPRHLRGEGVGGFPAYKLRRPPVNLEDSEGAIKHLVCSGKGAAATILVPPNSHADKHGQRWICVLKIVPHENFDAHRHINFHLWFHGVADANVGDDQVLGWRFEGSEGQETVHNLFHAQPLRGFCKGGPAEGFVPWMPDSFPTIPIAAKDQVQLALAALLTLGGKEALRRTVHSSDPALRRRARAYWGSVFANDPLKFDDTEPHHA
jgi:hypothetical protein